MITIIICGCLAFLLGTYFLYRDISKYNNKFSITDFWFSAALGLLIGFMGVIVGVGIAIFIPSKTEIKETVYKIEALQDNNTVSGSFFLGCGQINGDMKYVFYYQDSDSLFKLKQLPYEIVSIKYSNETKVTRYEEVLQKDALINKFSLGCGCGYPTYVIEVPKGTIINNYTLDAK